DRRLYAFFHPALRGDPLIFVEVALTAAIPGAIGGILAEERPHMAPEDATTAVFYSISNCQEGLRGISFGNFLIKQVVEELRREFETLTTFVTLSPVPGLRRWAESAAAKKDGGLTPAQKTLVANLATGAGTPTDPALAGLAARYLTDPDDSAGRVARDPVARFHLGNGARLERIHLGADDSPRGMSASWGVMVNYLYDLATIERNHEAFATRGEIIASPAVQKLARAGAK
ncbi:MAG: malonyl-CoA decarboxylase family protein, partial [Paracoccaceae bacterium]|nr:malonyl-CoA decarboxylase family protein [Paracoccaceae bacterium]